MNLIKRVDKWIELNNEFATGMVTIGALCGALLLYGGYAVIKYAALPMPSTQQSMQQTVAEWNWDQFRQYMCKDIERDVVVYNSLRMQLKNRKLHKPEEIGDFCMEEWQEYCLPTPVKQVLERLDYLEHKILAKASTCQLNPYAFAH